VCEQNFPDTFYYFFSIEMGEYGQKNKNRKFYMTVSELCDKMVKSPFEVEIKS